MLQSALRHLAVAEDCNIEENSQEFDYFLWLQGIGYSDRKNIAKLYFKG